MALPHYIILRLNNYQTHRHRYHTMQIGAKKELHIKVVDGHTLTGLFDYSATSGKPVSLILRSSGTVRAG